jgi:uncharacterized protein (DUF2062 family)
MLKGMEYRLSLPIQPYTMAQRTWATLAEPIRTILEPNVSAPVVAGSFALGTVISLLPVPGVDVVLISLLAVAFKSLHRGALLAALGVWNMFVVAPLYALTFHVSTMLVGAPVSFGTGTQWNEQLRTFGLELLVSNLIMVLSLTAVSYSLVFLLVRHRTSQYVLAARSARDNQ